MSEVRDKFPEFRALENNELELVLKIYNETLDATFCISNPSYYVSGALLLLVSFMFVNAQRLENPLTELLGYPEEEIARINKELFNFNSPQKVIMITVLASSVSGLGYISLRSFINSVAAGDNFGCFYISNAMLSGTMSIASACDSIEVWQSVAISAIGCFIYVFGRKITSK